MPHLEEEDFVLKKNFTIVHGVDSTFGKWPSIYGNAFFADSSYILEDLAFMFGENFMQFYNKNGYGDKYIEISDLIKESLSKHFQTMNINDYAFNIMVHLKNRKKLYLGD